MDVIWAALYVLGMILPILTLVFSTVAVFYFIRRRRRLGSCPRPPWQYVVVHLALGLGASLFSVSAGILGWLAVPGYLVWAERRVRSHAPQAAAEPQSQDPTVPRSWRLAVLFVLTGLLLPWAIGLGVKMHLDSMGRPTLSLGGFLDPASIVVELVLTLVAWAFPFVILASAVVIPWRTSSVVGPTRRNPLLPIWFAYGLGIAAAIPVFANVFWEFDSLMLLMPIGLMLVPPMAIGYWIGWWLLRRDTPT